MKNRNLNIALLVLVLLNIISLGFLWYTNRQHFDRLPARQSEVNFRFFKEIDFDEQQQKTFRRLFTEHRKNIRPKLEKMSELRTALFSGAEHLSNEERDQLLTELSAIQRSADSITYVHFGMVYEICNPDQKRKIDGFVRSMVNRDRREISRPK
ncbi:MAG: hypothetical protein RLQ12_21985 [Cyclobacteriaceae bacterium]